MYWTFSVSLEAIRHCLTHLLTHFLERTVQMGLLQFIFRKNKREKCIICKWYCHIWPEVQGCLWIWRFDCDCPPEGTLHLFLIAFPALKLHTPDPRTPADAVGLFTRLPCLIPLGTWVWITENEFGNVTLAFNIPHDHITKSLHTEMASWTGHKCDLFFVDTRCLPLHHSVITQSASRKKKMLLYFQAMAETEIPCTALKTWTAPGLCGAELLLWFNGVSAEARLKKTNKLLSHWTSLPLRYLQTILKTTGDTVPLNEPFVIQPSSTLPLCLQLNFPMTSLTSRGGHFHWGHHSAMGLDIHCFKVVQYGHLIPNRGSIFQPMTVLLNPDSIK